MTSRKLPKAFALTPVTNANPKSPFEPKRHWNHPRRNASCTRVMIASLRKEARSVADLEIEPSTQAATNSATTDISEYLVYRNKSGEGEGEDGIKQHNLRNRGGGELNRPPVIPHATGDIRIKASLATQAQLGICSDRP